MSEIKRAFIVFHYTEKMKSDLIMAAGLLEVLNSMGDMDVVGAEKLLVAYFNALIGEVNIAAKASGVHGFKEVNVKLEDAIQQTKQHNYVNAAKLVSEAISITTTKGHQAAQTLREKGLI
ncbi:MAG: hypothetical protein QMD23_03105 [Candidatus Bathyarchaeia archaeon]|nr:hypothetical protein [Candidatus Bathyarchaeia archaeon]